MHTEHSIVIKAPVDRVFEVTNDLERWSELLPLCRDLKVLETRETPNGPEHKIQVSFFTGGRLMTWRSKRLIDTKNRQTKSERLEPLGPFKFMKMQWIYESVPEGTKLVFIHDFKMKWWLLGYFLGKFYVVPRHIDKDAQAELKAIKARLESSAGIN